MRPFQIALLVTVVSSISVCSAATTNNSGEGKVAKAGSAIKRGVLWGPKKIGAGMKSMGEKTKKAFHHQ